MFNHFKPKFLSLMVASALVTPPTLVAQGAKKGDARDALIEKLLKRTEALESEVKNLRFHLQQVDRRSRRTRDPKTYKYVDLTKGEPGPKEAKGLANKGGEPDLANAVQAHGVHHGDKHPVAVESQSDLAHQLRKRFGIFGVPVVTGPMFGVKPDFQGGDLLVNSPDVDSDLSILRKRKVLEQALQKNNLETGSHPFVELSGEVNVVGTYSDGFTGPHSSDIDIAAIEVDFLAAINHWVTGFVAVKMDTASPSSDVTTGVPLEARVSNSRLFVDRGFMTFGNLQKFGGYVTVGQVYVPFGHYSSAFISDPMTKNIYRTRARAAVFGYDHNGGDHGFDVALFAFKGDTKKGGMAFSRARRVNVWGADGEYNGHVGEAKVTLGASYISNVTDSAGYQNTGGPTGAGFFCGFGCGVNGTQTVFRRVPGVDVRAKAALGDFSAVAEYITPTRSFGGGDLNFNGSPAKPKAFNSELAYHFKAFDKPSYFALSYGQTKEALGLNQPRKRYAGVFVTSLWRDSLQAIEFRHDKNYPVGSTASNTSIGIDLPTGGLSGAALLGKSSNQVLIDLVQYF